MLKLLFSILIIILLLGGIILLQISLSKRVNKWPGLILPIISGILSMIPLFLMPVSGNISVAQRIILAITILLISNILTIILIFVYITCRQKFKKKNQIEKMNIHDLH